MIVKCPKTYLLFFGHSILYILSQSNFSSDSGGTAFFRCGKGSRIRPDTP